MGIIGDGDIEVVMVAAVPKVAVLIRSNLSICMFVVVFVVLLGEAVLIVVVVVILFLTTTTTTTTTNTTTTTITTSFIAIQHTLKYCTPGGGGDGRVLVVMVG